MHHHKRTCKRIFSKIMLVYLTCVHQKRPVRYQITAKEIISTDDRQTDGQTNRRTDRRRVTIDIKKKYD